jgi:hypothetical protein
VLPVHPDLWHIVFGCCLRREKSHVEPIQAIPKPTFQPQLHSFTLPHTNPTFAHTCNDERTASLHLNYTRISLPQLDPTYSDFIYDVLISTKEAKKIRRLLVLDFRTDVNIMSQGVYQRLHTKASSCDPSIVLQVAGMGEVTPLCSVDVEWSLWADSTVYSTRFYVVEGCHFDLLLGRPSVIDHQLSRKDAAVGSRIRSSYQAS